MNRQDGVTLIELMIVVIIVVIVSTIAIPAYQDQVRAARRADGEALLLGVAQQQERFFTDNSTYTTDLRELGYSGAGVWKKSKDLNYKVRVQTTANCAITNCFRLLARPRVSGQQADGNLRLWSNGRKQRNVGGWQEGWQ